MVDIRWWRHEGKRSSLVKRLKHWRRLVETPRGEERLAEWLSHIGSICYWQFDDMMARPRECHSGLWWDENMTWEGDWRCTEMRAKRLEAHIERLCWCWWEIKHHVYAHHRFIVWLLPADAISYDYEQITGIIRVSTRRQDLLSISFFLIYILDAVAFFSRI